MPEELTHGQVVKGHGSVFHVKTADGIYPCRLRGKFRLEAKLKVNPVAVGDMVMCSFWRDEGSIEEILPRRTKLVRLLPGNRNIEVEKVVVANVDQVVIVLAARKPLLKISIIDRFLMATERQELPAILCVNKMDLVKDPAQLHKEMAVYEKLGYPVLFTSAKTNLGVDKLRDVLTGRLSVLSGHSGVGKSSLLNAVEPGLGLRVNAISERTQKGRHTTVHTELIPLSTSGFVADTPGFREFGLLTIAGDEVAGLFPEFREYLGQCKFNNCRHLAEPGCAIKAALKESKIARSRYENYWKIIEEMDGKRKW